MEDKGKYLESLRERIHSLSEKSLSDYQITLKLFPRISYPKRILFSFFGGDVSPDNIVRSCKYGAVPREGIQKADDTGRRVREEG